MRTRSPGLTIASDCVPAATQPAPDTHLNQEPGLSVASNTATSGTAPPIPLLTRSTTTAAAGASRLIQRR